MREVSRRSTRKTAVKTLHWPQLCAAMQGVIQRATDAEKVEELRRFTSTSQDTLDRIMRSTDHGGWWGPRMCALREFEQRILGTTTIADAMVGAVVEGEAHAVEADADEVTPLLLEFAADVMRKRVGGISLTEARQLLQPLDQAIERLQKMRRDLRSKVKRGVTS